VQAFDARDRAWSPAAFAPTQAHRLLEDLLGLSPTLLGFIQPRHFALLGVGMALLLCGLHLGRGGRLPDVWRGLGWGGGAAALLIAIALAPRIVGEVHLIAGESALRRGDSAQALEHLRNARAWKPALAQSWSHRQQVGELARLRDQPHSLDALLADAYRQLAAGRSEAASQRLMQARTLYPQDEPGIGRLLALTLAEAGIDAYNRGQIALAKDHWQESLAYVPTDPLPWYGLSLLHHKRQDFDAAVHCLEQVARLHSYFGYRRLPVRSQIMVTKSWAAAQRGDFAAAHEAYSRSLRPETW
jgi:tetratricopeptide (TPR) repeat protein